MMESPSFSKAKKTIRITGILILVSIIAIAASAFFGMPFGYYIAFCVLSLCLVSLIVVYRQLEKARIFAIDREVRSKNDYTRYERIVLGIIPAIELLAKEDAAIVDASGFSRTPISFPQNASDAASRLEDFIQDFSSPEDGSIERTRSMASLAPSFDYLREMELRVPFIEEILKRVVSHTEQAAMTLIERFSVISEQTDKSDRNAKNAIEALGSNDENGLESLIKKSHESIVGRNIVINDFLKLNRENADRVKKISELVNRSEELISGIEDITERSKLIAFNMAVESAKIGDKGRGFKVIVNELQRLNDQTTSFARDIMEIVKSFRSYNEELLDQWLVKSETLTTKVRADSDQAELAVTALKRSYELTGTLFRSLSDSAISVNKSMSDILESLQFQDITRQQIEGAVSFLLDIDSSLLQLKNLFEALGYSKGDSFAVLRKIRDKHEKQLKVSKDHDLFEIIERRYK